MGRNSGDRMGVVRFRQTIRVGEPIPVSTNLRAHAPAASKPKAPVPLANGHDSVTLRKKREEVFAVMY